MTPTPTGERSPDVRATTRYETDRAERQIDEIGRLARPLTDAGDLDPLLERIGRARIVQVGEASHGTA